MKIIDFLSHIEKEFGVKCVHNEIKIISLIAKKNKVPSLEILHETGRSISAHNSDLKRLSALGLIETSNGEFDKRQRLYSLTSYGHNLIEFLEHLLDGSYVIHDGDTASFEGRGGVVIPDYGDTGLRD